MEHFIWLEIRIFTAYDLNSCTGSCKFRHRKDCFAHTYSQVLECLADPYFSLEYFLWTFNQAERLIQLWNLCYMNYFWKWRLYFIWLLANTATVAAYNEIVFDESVVS